MADRIHASSEWLDKCARDLSSIESAIERAGNTLGSINLRRDEGGNLRASLSCRLSMNGARFNGSNAADDIRQLHSAARSLSGATASFSRGASQAARLFEQAENNAVQILRALSQGSDSDVYEKGGISGGGVSDSGDGYDRGVITALGYPQDPSKWTEDMKKKYEDMIKGGTTFVDANGRRYFKNDDTWIITDVDGTVIVASRELREHELKIYGKDGSYTTVKTEVPLERDFDIDSLKRKRPDLFPRYDENGKKIEYDGPKFDSLFEKGVKATQSYSAVHWEKKYEKGAYSNSTTVDVSKLTTTAEVYAGLYSVEYTEDGKEIKKFAPGVRAEIGASYSAIEVKHTGRYGNDIAGLDYGVSTKGLSASLKADSELGIVDGKLTAHVGANAEVLLGEVSGEAGVDVLGVEAKVKGSVNYGIGAHADIGLHDGKVTADIGATLGIGASVKIEIDYGKAVDNVVKGAQKAYDNGKKAVKAMKGMCESFLKLW